MERTFTPRSRNGQHLPRGRCRRLGTGETPPKTGNTRVVDVDEDTPRVLGSYKFAQARLSFTLAKADNYIFGDDDGKLRSPNAKTSR